MTDDDRSPAEPVPDAGTPAVPSAPSAHATGSGPVDAEPRAHPGDDVTPDDADAPGHSDALLLPPVSGQAPERLLVFLHGANGTPTSLVGLALAWQIKFRSAAAALPAAPHRMTETAAGGRAWIVPARHPVTAADVDAAVDALLPRLDALAAQTGVPPDRTIVVGLGQGSSLALELAFRRPARAGILVGYGSRLYRIPRDGERAGASIILVHGGLDTLVPIDFAEAARRRLAAIDADVQLVRLDEEGHTIGQTLINAGTQAVMDALYGERLRTRGTNRLH